MCTRKTLPSFAHPDGTNICSGPWTIRCSCDIGYTSVTYPELKFRELSFSFLSFQIVLRLAPSNTMILSYSLKTCKRTLTTEIEIMEEQDCYIYIWVEGSFLSETMPLNTCDLMSGQLGSSAEPISLNLLLFIIVWCRPGQYPPFATSKHKSK